MEQEVGRKERRRGRISEWRKRGRGEGRGVKKAERAGGVCVFIHSLSAVIGYWDAPA